MARLHLLHSPLSPTKFIFLVWCGAILGATLVVSFFRASFSSVYIPISSNWVIGRPAPLLVPNASSIPPPKGDVFAVRKLGSEKNLSPTFADLSAPDLLWEKMPPAPVPRIDGLFYVFAGYGSIDYVHSHVDVYNFSSDIWLDRFDMPKDLAHSHLGVVTDGRYIYVVSGQYGPQCRPLTSRSFALDTQTKTWKSLPPLPAPRACVVVNDRLFVIGGQEGYFMAKPNSPIFKCSPPA